MHVTKIKSHTKIDHFAYKDVGKGREQDAEASSVMVAVKSSLTANTYRGSLIAISSQPAFCSS